MPGRRWWVGAVLMLLAGSVGCCGFCDRWCGQRQAAAAPVCTCQPAYVAPTAPVAQTAGVAPASGWCVPCVPCAPPAR
jgi:hypothetical protein